MAKNTKETNFFYDQYARGLSWYKSFFTHCSNHIAIGEISNLYIYDPHVPERIAVHLPDVKLIAILRNPFDRIRSAYAYRKRAGQIDARMDLFDAISQYPDLIDQNFYGYQLRHYLNFFSREQLLIAFYDDLIHDPEGFIASIFKFIGVDGSFQSRAIYERVNPEVAARSRYLSMLARFGARSLRSAGLYSLLERFKNSAVLRIVLFSDANRASQELQADVELNGILARHFGPQIAEVEDITGRRLAHWYPTTGGSDQTETPIEQT